MTTKVILEREGFRFVEKGIIELNGKPDYRLQMQDHYTKRWQDAYLFDNSDIPKNAHKNSTSHSLSLIAKGTVSNPPINFAVKPNLKSPHNIV